MGYKFIAWMVLANLLWASSDVAAKFAMDDLSFQTLTWLRISFAALTVAVLFRTSILTTLRESPRLFILAGIVGYSLNFLFFNWGLSLSSASHGSAIRPVEVLMVALLARIILKEVVTYRVYIGSCLGALGVYWIVAGHSSGESGGHVVIGDLLLVGATFFDALYSVVCKKMVGIASPLRSVAAAIVVGWLVSSVFLAEPAIGEIAATGVPVPALLAAIYLGVFVTVVSYWIYAGVLTKIDTHVAASTILLQPVFGVILAVLLLNESITLSFVLGAAAVIGSVCLVLFSGGSAKPAEPLLAQQQEVSPLS